MHKITAVATALPLPITTVYNNKNNCACAVMHRTKIALALVFARTNGVS